MMCLFAIAFPLPFAPPNKLGDSYRTTPSIVLLVTTNVWGSWSSAKSTPVTKFCASAPLVFRLVMKAIVLLFLFLLPLPAAGCGAGSTKSGKAFSAHHNRPSSISVRRHHRLPTSDAVHSNQLHVLEHLPLMRASPQQHTLTSGWWESWPFSIRFSPPSPLTPKEKVCDSGASTMSISRLRFAYELQRHSRMRSPNEITLRSKS